MNTKKELTIEEKAREYADNLIYPHCFLENPKLKRASNNLVSASYRSGYNEALNDTRWRSIEEEMPPFEEVKDNNQYLIYGYFKRGNLKKNYVTLQHVSYHDSLDFGTFMFDLPSGFIATHWIPIPSTP